MTGNDLEKIVGRGTNEADVISPRHVVARASRGTRNLSLLFCEDASVGDWTSQTPQAIGNILCDALETLPREIGNLQSLQRLILRHCASLASLPHAIGNLQNLAELEVSGCFTLRTLPPEIGRLQSLENLVIHGKLDSLPPEIGNLKNRKEASCNVGKNPTVFPREIVQLTNLEEMSFEVDTWESFDQTTPDICQLRNLQSLYIYHSVFASDQGGMLLSTDLGNLSYLTKLFVRRCCVPPPVVQGLKNLKSVTFNACRDIPVELKDLDHLETMSFEGYGEEESVNLLSFFSGSWNPRSRPPKCVSIRCSTLDEKDFENIVLAGLPNSLEELRLGYIVTDFGACLRKGLPQGLKKLTMDNVTRNEKTVSHVLDCGQSSLERLVVTNPGLGRLVLGIRPEGKEEVLTPTFYYQLLFNRCCGGRSLSITTHSTYHEIPLSMWPTMLERVTQEFDDVTTDIPRVHEESSGLDRWVAKEMEASILYSLIRGDISWSMIA
jgi:hypothetical protein